MHRPKEGPRFFYNAYASAFSGRITRPFDHLIDVQAPCALSPNGGYAASRAEGFRLKEIISFSSAVTTVTGDGHEEEEAWNQVATSTIENLNIMGQVTADRVIAILSIKRPFFGPPTFRIVGSRFDNLHVGGERVTVEFNHGIDSWDAAVKAFARGEEPHGSVIVGSAVSSVKSSHLAESNVIDIPDFGRVILGEYLITPYARSLSMFRVELGCGTEGTGDGGNVGGNGTRFPAYP